MPPIKAKELTAAEVRQLRHGVIKSASRAKTRRVGDPCTAYHAVGGVPGLLLQCRPPSSDRDVGARSWILRTTVGAKRRDIGLGGYPEVSLAEARESARLVKSRIREGVDPVAERKAKADALRLAQAKELKFAEAARRAHRAKTSAFRNKKHAKQWISTLETYAFPHIADLPVAQVELAHIMKVLEPIWHEKPETASRVRQRLESVISWATVAGFRDGENPARWDGNLKELLPPTSRVKKVKHHRALPWQEMGAYMMDLRARNGTSARALEFLVLTAARSGEVRHATWSEIDYEEAVWTVPAERMKAGKEHKVPLSDPAIALLKALPRLKDSEYIFPAVRGGPLSDTSLLAVNKRMEVEAVPHGFRSSFKDWARRSTSYPDEVSELALAHVNSDATRAAYARDELLPQRRRLMGDWAQYLSTARPGGVVVPINEVSNERP